MSYAKTEIVLSIADLGAAGATVSSDPGSFSYGDIIMPTKDGLVLAGIRFYWPGGHGALSVKASLWNANTSTRVTSATVSVNAAGVYVALFATPTALTQYNLYYLSVWETSGNFAIEITGANVSTFTLGTMTVANGFNLKNLYPGYFRISSGYASGDAVYATPDTTDLLGVLEPVFV